MSLLLQRIKNLKKVDEKKQKMELLIRLTLVSSMQNNAFGSSGFSF